MQDKRNHENGLEQKSPTYSENLVSLDAHDPCRHDGTVANRIQQDDPCPMSASDILGQSFAFSMITRKLHYLFGLELEEIVHVETEPSTYDHFIMSKFDHLSLLIFHL